MKNRLEDLNNLLFEQLERLNDDDASPEEVEKEIEKSKAMTQVADRILETQELAFNIFKKADEMGIYNCNAQKALLGIEKL